MNKITNRAMLSLITLILCSISVMAATLNRDMLGRVDPGADFTVRLTVPDAVADKPLTVEETLPKGITLKTWEIAGAKESKSQLQGDSKKYRVKDGAYGWSVTPTGLVTITYTATAPQTEGTLDFDAVYFDPNGFNHNPFKLSVAKAAPLAPASESAPAPAPAPVAAPEPPKTKAAPAAPASSGTGVYYAIGALVILIILIIGWYYYSKNK